MWATRPLAHILLFCLKVSLMDAAVLCDNQVNIETRNYGSQNAVVYGKYIVVIKSYISLKEKKKKTLETPSIPPPPPPPPQ